MYILFTICGRAGSKGIKNKNSMDFLGHPLALYTLSAVDLYRKKNPDVHCDIAVNTDSKALMEIVKKTNLNIQVIKRDALLGQDTTPKVAVISSTLKDIVSKRAEEYDMVVDLDITSPLRTVRDIENLIAKKKQGDAEVVFSVTDSRRNPYFNMVKKTENGYEQVIRAKFNTRQEAPSVFDMNASLYAYEINFLKSGMGIFDAKCDAIQMLDTAVLDLDHPNDWEFMQVIAKYLYDTRPEFGEVQGNIKRMIE